MKHAIIVHLEIPDEAPESVSKEVVKGFTDVIDDLATGCREHFAGQGVNVEILQLPAADIEPIGFDELSISYAPAEG